MKKKSYADKTEYGYPIILSHAHSEDFACQRLHSAAMTYKCHALRKFWFLEGNVPGD